MPPEMTTVLVPILFFAVQLVRDAGVGWKRNPEGAALSQPSGATREERASRNPGRASQLEAENPEGVALRGRRDWIESNSGTGLISQ